MEIGDWSRLPDLRCSAERRQHGLRADHQMPQATAEKRVTVPKPTLPAPAQYPPRLQVVPLARSRGGPDCPALDIP